MFWDGYCTNGWYITRPAKLCCPCSAATAAAEPGRPENGTFCMVQGLLRKEDTPYMDNVRFRADISSTVGHGQSHSTLNDTVCSDKKLGAINRQSTPRCPRRRRCSRPVTTERCNQPCEHARVEGATHVGKTHCQSKSSRSSQRAHTLPHARLVRTVVPIRRVATQLLRFLYPEDAVPSLPVAVCPS